MKAVDRILWLTYGRAPASSDYREKAEIILEELSRTDIVERLELMQSLGLDSESEGDVQKLNRILQPLKGSKSSNPLELTFVSSVKRDGTVCYRVSRDGFDASMNKLRKDVQDFLDTEFSGEPEFDKVLDQVLWLAYSNHPQTAQHKERGRQILVHLLENGESSKEDLLKLLGLDPRSESQDRKFRRTLQYLRGSWEEEESKKNPLHTENHGFLVSSTSRDGDTWYSVDLGEFRSSMNVVVKNIRLFLGE